MTIKLIENANFQGVNSWNFNLRLHDEWIYCSKSSFAALIWPISIFMTDKSGQSFRRLFNPGPIVWVLMCTCGRFRPKIPGVQESKVPGSLRPCVPGSHLFMPGPGVFTIHYPGPLGSKIPEFQPRIPGSRDLWDLLYSQTTPLPPSNSPGPYVLVCSSYRVLKLRCSILVGRSRDVLKSLFGFRALIHCEVCNGFKYARVTVLQVAFIKAVSRINMQTKFPFLYPQYFATFCDRQKNQANWYSRQCLGKMNFFFFKSEFEF